MRTYVLMQSAIVSPKSSSVCCVFSPVYVNVRVARRISYLKDFGAHFALSRKEMPISVSVFISMTPIFSFAF